MQFDIISPSLPMRPERPTVYWAEPPLRMLLLHSQLLCVSSGRVFCVLAGAKAPAGSAGGDSLRQLLLLRALGSDLSGADSGGVGVRFFHRTGARAHAESLARRGLITLSIVLNVGLIVSVKYSPRLPWILPLGLSFYAFQSLTYTLDIYRRDAEPASKPSCVIWRRRASFRPRWLGRLRVCRT